MATGGGTAALPDRQLPLRWHLLAYPIAPSSSRFRLPTCWSPPFRRCLRRRPLRCGCDGHVNGGSSASQSATTSTSTHASSRIAANADAPACTRIHSLLVHRIIAQEWCYCAHNATCAAPATLGPLRTAARTQRLFHCAGSHTHTPLPPPAVASTSARSAIFLFRVPTLFSAGRFPFLLAACRTAPAYGHARARAALHHARARARTRVLARARKNDRRRTTRRADIRSC